MMRLRVYFSALVVVLAGVSGAQAQSLSDSVRDAVATNPLIGEAAANRRAIDNEVDQARGLYRPRLDLEAFAGPHKFNRDSLSADDNLKWRVSRSASLVVRQTLFDGFFRANEVFRQSARVNGAAARVLERAEIVALDAIEAHIDLIRHHQILSLADRNIRTHRSISSRIADLSDNGTATRGDLLQAEERLAAAEAIRADVVRALGEVQARYKRVVGREPGKLAAPTLPYTGIATKSEAVARARSNHPALTAAAFDIETAEAEHDQTKSLFLPRIGIEGRSTLAQDIGGTPGHSNEFSARVTLNWNLYNGGVDTARKRERRERLTETQIRQDRLRRDIDEAAERAFSDVRANDLRLSALRREAGKAGQVRAAYIDEFDAGLRSLLDLLDSENTVFNSNVQKVTSESIAIFSRYQLIASTGALLETFDIAPPADSVVDNSDTRYVPIGGFTLEPLRKW